MRWVIRKQDEGKLVRDFLSERAFSSRLIKNIKQHGQILLNKHPVTVKQTLNTRDELEIVMPEEYIGDNIAPISYPLDIIYEDEVLLAINKPRGLSVLPNMNDHITLANALADYYKKHQVRSSIHIVTRLDKYTSGVVIVAKNSYVHHVLSKTSIEREYRAILEGQLINKTDTINLPISRNLPSIIERKIDPNGKHAVTHYEVIRESEHGSLLKVWLDTGRTHQIRVHFSHLGHPLIGDGLYGSTKLEIEGQALHCRYVKLCHPITKEAMSFIASYPSIFKNIFNGSLFQT
ncbi:RluA family pseudouridine synthase [Aquisalibacillus elongatus]|uniref:Pseudouridine synthase n=1 Tax=Aquisalibacillus elongatus TaxID=485577 RepID=A0A3N5B4T2_9BACI|nr:RluA family pseudouridine synthase [Aquisalibacillus elongatus]RPF52119.1 ribosomal large subunit pseudouridine synthase D [Aquisalibacillus elongatus]